MRAPASLLRCAASRLAARGLLALTLAAPAPATLAAPAADDGSRAGAPATPSPLGLSCLTCHGLKQRPGAHATDLRALSPEQIRTALRAFRDGSQSGTVMPRLGRGLQDGEIDALATELGARR